MSIYFITYAPFEFNSAPFNDDNLYAVKTKSQQHGLELEPKNFLNIHIDKQHIGGWRNKQLESVALRKYRLHYHDYSINFNPN